GGRLGGRVEVINCAVPAFGTEQERRFYERSLLDYRPQIVLLMTAKTDNLTAEGRLFDTLYAKPYPWERVLITPYLIRLLTHFSQPRSYTGVVQEVSQLRGLVEGNGGRLAIVQFDAVWGSPGGNSPRPEPLNAL